MTRTPREFRWRRSAPRDKDRIDKLNFFVLVIAIGESAGLRSTQTRLHPAPTLRHCTTRSLTGGVFARSDIQLTPGPAWNIGICRVNRNSVTIDRERDRQTDRQTDSQTESKRERDFARFGIR